jgi:hypothetical protein
MIQLLEGGGQQFGLHGVPLAANGPWTMARSAFGSVTFAPESPPSRGRRVSGLVLVGSLSTGGRVRAPGVLSSASV